MGSRRVIQVSAFMMLLFGLMTKPLAVFVTIPPAVLGAMYISLFGGYDSSMITVLRANVL